MEKKIVVLTGEFSIKRSDLKSRLEALGYVVEPHVTERTSMLISGEHSGSKLMKARDLKIKVIHGESFIAGCL